MCIENIFFKTKKLQMKILLGKSQIALRKCKGNNRNLTAGHLKQEGALERLVHLDEGYKFLNSRLVQSNPVTCARHFDYQFNQFLRYFLMSNAAPLGKVADWFYRVETPQRGSPHIHMLIWLEDAPMYGCDGDDEVTSFIDEIITCKMPNNNLELRLLVNRQIHRHSQTCRKKSKAECRFNFPQPPMNSTKIYIPLRLICVKLRLENIKIIGKTSVNI